MPRDDHDETGPDHDEAPRSRAAEYGDRERTPSFATRVVAALQNGLEVARFGGLGERQPSPYDVVDDAAHHRLRHYYPDAGNGGPPALLIPPLMMTSEVWDVAPESSAVTSLYNEGADPWVVDFGSPEQEEGGLERTLTDHVVAVSESIDAVRKATGRDVHVMGYSQGGMFAYQAGAYRRSEGMASIVTFGSPVDLHNQLPFDLPAETIADLLERFGKIQADLLPEGIPSWATKLGFQLMDPINTVRQRIDFAMKLYDREALAPREGMRRFLESEAWIAFPGPALAEVMAQLVAHNRMLRGGFVIDGQTVTLADLTCPILAIVGESDSIAPPPSVRAIRVAAPNADSYQIKVPAGHFGLVVGSRSAEITWPSVTEWLDWSEEEGPLPSLARPLEDPALRKRDSTPTSALDGLRRQAELAVTLGRDMLGDASDLVGDRFGFLGRISNVIGPQIPRMMRLSNLRSETPTSLGRALEERAKEAPDDTFFLFEGRAHSYQAANERVDNIVRGFLECGVRQGQHVGVFMETRPSAVAATVALSRLGAVAVLLRPDLPIESQLALAPVDHLLTDPERGVAAREAYGKEVLVLGGGGDARTLAEGLRDMEAIDPDEVEVPEGHRPNPGTAGELALILITGDAERQGKSRITNRRWATSAYGTATACALTPSDTVYCCSPTHHATGIMVCVSGALVSGARLAMTTDFEPEVFWQEVRRYGVNVVFYTGAWCHTLVNAPETRAEHHHPIRLFAGSGMPKGVWKRVMDRFAPVQVVEFFASTEGNAVLVNLTGKKAGSVGRQLPGGADLGVATWDLAKRRRVELESGFAQKAKAGEVGLLLSRVDPERGEVEARPLRGVFEPGDAWLDTGDLVRFDNDGDYWLVDAKGDVIPGKDGPITTVTVEDVLTTELPFVDLAAVYGVPAPEPGVQIPVAAITLRPGEKVDPQALREVVEHRLHPPSRPQVIRILPELPLTSGHRIRKRLLREAGLGSSKAKGERLWLAPGEKAYLPLSAEIAKTLVRAKASAKPRAKPAPKTKPGPKA